MAARGCVLLTAPPEAEASFLLPEGPLLVATDPLQLLLHAHPGPAALGSTQLLLHCAAWTLLLAGDKTEYNLIKIQDYCEKCHRGDFLLRAPIIVRGGGLIQHGVMVWLGHFT